MRAALLLAAPLLLAGCTGADGSFGFAQGDTPLVPYFHEYREIVDGAHAKTFDAPVDAQASLVNVTVHLEPRTNGVPVFDAAPASLQVRLLDPSGTILQEATLDPQHPIVTLVAVDPAPGMYHVAIEGVGVSQELAGADYGAAYLVSIEVLYEETF